MDRIQALRKNQLTTKFWPQFRASSSGVANDSGLPVRCRRHEVQSRRFISPSFLWALECPTLASQTSSTSKVKFSIAVARARSPRSHNNVSSSTKAISTGPRLTRAAKGYDRVVGRSLRGPQKAPSGGRSNTSLSRNRCEEAVRHAVDREGEIYGCEAIVDPPRKISRSVERWHGIQLALYAMGLPTHFRSITLTLPALSIAADTSQSFTRTAEEKSKNSFSLKVRLDAEIARKPALLISSTRRYFGARRVHLFRRKSGMNTQVEETSGQSNDHHRPNQDREFKADSSTMAIQARGIIRGQTATTNFLSPSARTPSSGRSLSVSSSVSKKTAFDLHRIITRMEAIYSQPTSASKLMKQRRLIWRKDQEAERMRIETEARRVAKGRG